MIAYGRRISRLIKLMFEIKANPNQSIQGMIKSVGISKAQFYKDKAVLAASGFEFSREKGSFKIRKAPFIPICSITLTENVGCLPWNKDMISWMKEMLLYLWSVFSRTKSKAV